MSRPTDPAAPVTRFAAGDRISWKYGTKTKTGTIHELSADDAVYCDGTGDGYAPWGPYFGRTAWVVCDDTSCFCQKYSGAGPITGKTLHCCNECQFTADTTTVFVPMALF